MHQHNSLHGIFDRPLGIFMPLAVQLAKPVSTIQAIRAFVQCFFVPHTAASATVAIPFRIKNEAILISASSSRIGRRAYTWNAAMSENAARTPAARANTLGTPSFRRALRVGRYASDVHGAANALCHVSDLYANLLAFLPSENPSKSHTKIPSSYLPCIMVQTKQDCSYISQPSADSSIICILLAAPQTPTR